MIFDDLSMLLDLVQSVRLPITINGTCTVNGDSSFPGIEAKPESVTLTAEQFKRYQQWNEGLLLIQEALPELSRSDREALITGLHSRSLKDLRGQNE